MTAGVAIATLSLSVGSAAQARQATHPQMSSWDYRADWNGGFSGWMSFPLAQDVGYDPSLHTVRQGNRTVLFHELDAHGEKRAWLGFVCPLKFSADSTSAIETQYRLHVAGQFSDGRLILVATDGHRYTAALPSGDGEETVRITGAELGLTSPTTMDALILEGRVQNPPSGSHSQWVLESFVLHGVRPKQVALVEPEVDAGVDGAFGSFVSREVVESGTPLKIELASGARSATVALYDPTGHQTKTVEIPSGQKFTDVSPGAHPQPGLWRASVSQDDAKTELQFLVVGALPAHGHLLLSQQRLKQLSDDETYAGIRREIHEHARALAAKIDFSADAGDNIEAMALGPGLQPAYSGELTPYLLLVESYANAVAYNALDYKLNGDRTSLDDGRRALLAVVQWKTWTPRRFREHGMNTYYEVGCIAQRLAFGYDLIADQFSPQERSTVEQSFWKQAIEPVVREYFLYNRDPIAASNWMANSVGGALAAAIATAGDSPEWNRREAPAIAELEFAFEQVLHGLFPGDGSEAEPAGYENFAMQGISWGMSALSALGMHPQGAVTMLKGFWWPLYATVKPGTQLDTGDFDGHLKGLSGFAWGAEHSGIPELRAFYQHGTHLNFAHDASAEQNGHQLEELLGPLDLACCSEPATEFASPPASRIFPTRGSAVLRSGWRADSTVISLRVGPWFNHEHHDEGSFQVAAFGQTLVTEAGYASYYTDPHYQDYFTQAAGHNTLLIDADPFTQSALRGRYWPGSAYPHLKASFLGAAMDYVAADLTSAYDGRLESYQREYVFLKPDILVIRDRAHSAQPHRFSWLLHASGEAKLTIAGAQASIRLPSASGEVSANLTSAGPNAAWETATMPISILRFKDLDGARIDAPQELRLDSPSGSSAHFLVGMKLGVNHGNEGLQPFTAKAGEGLQTVRGESAGVVFRTANGPLQASTLTTDGSLLAWHGAGKDAGWMTVDATSITQGKSVVFHASTPISVEWEKSPSGLNVTVHNANDVAIEIYSAARPQSLRLDDKPTATIYKDHQIKVGMLPAGEHRLLIR